MNKNIPEKISNMNGTAERININFQSMFYFASMGNKSETVDQLDLCVTHMDILTERLKELRKEIIK